MSTFIIGVSMFAHSACTNFYAVKEGVICDNVVKGISNMNIGQQYCSEIGKLHYSLKGKYIF